jgi:hypothetical protein
MGRSLAQEQDRVTWVLWPHWCGQSSKTHLQGQRVTHMVPEQQMTAVPVVQHCPMGLIVHTMLEPQPMMLEHWNSVGQAGTLVVEVAADTWRPAWIAVAAI